MERTQVIIVGAGPVGLSAAVCLAGFGIDCIVLEKREALSTASKASTFQPPTLEILSEFGVLGPMMQMGRVADRIQYRTAAGAVLAQFDHDLLVSDTPFPHRLHLEQSALTQLLLDKLKRGPRGEVRFGCTFLNVAQQTNDVMVRYVEASGAKREIAADYVLAADGAHSTVRDALGLALEGSAYPGQVLRLVVTDPLSDIIPGLGQVSYIFSPDNSSISLLQMPDCWRVIIRLPDGFDPEEVVLPEWYMPVVRQYIPQFPGELTLREHDIYGARKMLASGHGTGRVFLMGDALHLTNTRGGMNMNCGIHDAYELGGAIAKAITLNAPELVERAARRRRQVAQEQLLPRTDRNITGGANLLAQMRTMSADPVQAREMLVRAAMLDMAPPRRLVQTSRVQAQ
ncbi:MAG: FAD-dependent monooxygenase [Pararhodobacter sp.]|nr:FAD-dependent monooxygenase [Pararhodobacter sp.]